MKYQPCINNKGEWLLNPFDVECLTLGTGVMGCGGGGDPEIGKKTLLQAMKDGYQPRIVNPKSFEANGDAFCIAYMGAAGKASEELAQGEYLQRALQMSKTLREFGFKPGMTPEEVQITAQSKDHFAISKNGGKIMTVNIEEPTVPLPNPKGFLAVEIGGMNTLMPIAFGAQRNVAIIDCDGFGRAAPQLSEYAPFIYGDSSYPAVLYGQDKDQNPKYFSCVYSKSSEDLENFFRQVTTDLHGDLALCLPPSNKCDITKKMCQNTITRAWSFGYAILKAREERKSPVEAIMNVYTGGKVLGQGWFIEGSTKDKGGFLQGTTCIQTKDKSIDDEQKIYVDILNEYMTVYQWVNKERKFLATTPDLITIIETDTGRPIQSFDATPDINGKQVTILALPANPLMSSEKALKVTGPQNFKKYLGYETTYCAIGIYTANESNAKNITS